MQSFVDVPGGQPRGGVRWISRKGEMGEERFRGREGEKTAVRM